jgi:hypothetical protein
MAVRDSAVSPLTVTNAVVPERRTLSTPSSDFKAELAFAAAPHPPPEKETEKPEIEDASAASTGAARAGAVHAPKAHIIPNRMVGFMTAQNRGILLGRK